MNALRTWRTVRHLSPRQAAWRFACRTRFQLLRRVGPAPVLAAARRLPLPDLEDARLAKLAAHMLAWQQAAHGQPLADVCAGRFTLLNRRVDFGSLEGVRWRTDLDGGNIALRRMTLGYFGYAPPLLATGEPAALGAVASLVASLSAQNPFSAPGVFRDIWNPYCVSHRLLNLLLGIHLFERRQRQTRQQPAMSEPHRTALMAHIRFCAAFVRLNLEWDLGYNHLLKNLTALVAYAAGLAALPPSWRFLSRSAPAVVARQVLADGGHAERSPMYHLLAMFDLQLLADAGVLSPAVAEAVAEQLAAMRSALTTLTLPDGDIALFNDAWLGEAPPARPFAAPPSPERPGSGAKRVLPHCGYVQLRAADHAAVFDCGACGPDDNPAHAHADFLAVEATVAGRRFLVDAGVATYGAGPARQRCRSAAAHNGPRLADCEPVELWHSFRVGRRARAHPLPMPALSNALCCAGWHEGYRSQGTRVARALALFPRQGLLIVDLWLGTPDAEPIVDFLIPAAWQTQDGVRYRQDSGGTVAEATFETLIGDAALPQPATYWPRYDAADDAMRIRVRPDAAKTDCCCASWLGWAGQPPIAAPADWRVHLAAALARA